MAHSAPLDSDRGALTPDNPKDPKPEDSDQPGGGGGKGGGDGGDRTPPHHPLIEGMFQNLPARGQSWTLDEAADWLHAAAYNLRFAYKLKIRSPSILKSSNQTKPPYPTQSDSGEMKFVRPHLGGIGRGLIVIGALWTALSAYHLQRSRADYIAQFHPKPFNFCGTPDHPNDKIERFLRDHPPVK